MRALVVHESMFGNTETVARAVADGLSTVAGIEVDRAAVHSASTDLADVDLVVVGGPTHAFSMSRESTRADAVTKGANEAVARVPASGNGSKSSSRRRARRSPRSTPASDGLGCRAQLPERPASTSGLEASGPLARRPRSGSTA